MNQSLRVFLSFLTITLLVITFPISAKKKQYFSQLEFEVDFTITHPIMTGDFIGDDRHEILIKGEKLVDGVAQQIFSLYSYSEIKNSYEQVREVTIPSETIAFDLFTNNKNKMQVLLLNAKSIVRLKFDDNIFTQLADMEGIYKEVKPQYILNKNFVRDINGDGLDDIVIPNFSQLSILLQKANSEFELLNLPIAATSNMKQSEISYSETPFFLADTNLDDRKDIVVVENNGLKVFQQLEGGEFTSISNFVELPFNVSGLPWWFDRKADGSLADQSNLHHSMVEKFQDINGDGIADLMIRKTKSSGVLDKENQYDIYFGRNKAGLISFDEDPNTQIKAEGTLSDLKLIDLNNDKRMEIVVSYFDIGVSQIIGALLSGSIDQDVLVYTLDAKDNFSGEPVFSEEVELKFSLSSGSEGQPVVLSADFNGDELNELLLSTSEKRLAIYLGKENLEQLDAKSKKHKLVLPNNGSMLAVSDLNGDNKDEVIVRYGKHDDENLQKKVIILTVHSRS